MCEHGLLSFGKTTFISSNSDPVEDDDDKSYVRRGTRKLTAWLITEAAALLSFRKSCSTSLSYNNTY